MKKQLLPSQLHKKDTLLKLGSLFGLAIAVSGLFYLVTKNYIFSKNPIVIIVQTCSIVFMIWARITFGIRSFHASANTTKGELVTSGPYRWLRHPIYASVIYFTWASVISNPYIDTIVAVSLITCGLFVRIILEEKSLKLAYANYVEYSKRTKRIIPFLF